MGNTRQHILALESYHGGIGRPSLGGAMLKYTVILIPEEDGGYSVEVPALPGCYTQGETKKEAIELYLESCQAHNELIPQELGIESLIIAVREPIA
jgi:predicted RNase H-like HicB family nuclease